MRQFVLPALWDGGPRCQVGARESHHLVRVLRLGPGDRFPALDASGLRHACEVLVVDADGMLLSVGPGLAEGEGLPDLRGGAMGGTLAAPSRAAREGGAGRPRLTLVAALLKGEKFDLVVRQAAEAGVARIIPLESSRCLGGPVGANRRQRQERLIREALQQSGSTMPTEIEESVRVEDLPDRLGPASGRRRDLLLHEAPLVEEGLHRYLDDSPDEVVVCVGPEGGFSPGEIAFLRDRGFSPLRLPGAVLRAETAALFAVAAIQVILSERKSWFPAKD